MILLAVLLVIARTIGSAASAGASLPLAASEATEMAALWVSTRPPTAAPTFLQRRRCDQHGGHRAAKNEGGFDAEGASGFAILGFALLERAHGEDRAVNRRGRAS